MRRSLLAFLFLLSFLLTACEPFFTQQELDRVTNQGHISVTYRMWWEEAFTAYTSGGYNENQRVMFYYGAIPQEERDSTPMPQSVRDAYRFYYDNVEVKDWGTVYLAHFTINEKNELWLVRTTTDGDDGWIEVYGGDGRWLEGGRTWIEIIGWIKTEKELPALRETVFSGEYLQSMHDRAERTLWKPN